MPKVKDQDMFPMEQCNKCNVNGILHLTLRGRYMWRCPDCFGTWRTPNSHMDLINSIKGPINFDIPAGIIAEEKNI